MTSKDQKMGKQGDAGKRKHVTQKQTLMPLNEQLGEIFVVKLKYTRSNKKLPLKYQISICTV